MARSGAAETTSDGRVRRGERNRSAILDAVFELVGEGELWPTAEQVAERAGVGTRTVFRHFDDMDSLHAELSARLEKQVQPILDEPRRGGTLVERAGELVRRRARVFEALSPYKRSGNLHRWRSEFLQRSHARFAKGLRSDLVSALPELERAPETTFDAVDLLLSFEAWDRLRSDQRLGRERAEATLESALLAILA